MKKIILISLILLTISFSFNSFAEQKKEKSEKQPPDWTFFALCFFPDFPTLTDTENVYGLKLGLPVSSGEDNVYGMELSILGSGTSYIEGGQISLANFPEKLYGFQLGVVNATREDGAGLQLSLMNVNSFDFYGLQLGALNMTGNKADGTAVGLYNYAEDSSGVQVGLVNICGESGVQIGLVNIIQNSWLPFMPFINFY